MTNPPKPSRGAYAALLLTMLLIGVIGLATLGRQSNLLAGLPGTASSAASTAQIRRPAPDVLVVRYLGRPADGALAGRLRVVCYDRHGHAVVNSEAPAEPDPSAESGLVVTAQLRLPADPLLLETAQVCALEALAAVDNVAGQSTVIDGLTFRLPAPEPTAPGSPPGFDGRS